MSGPYSSTKPFQNNSPICHWLWPYPARVSTWSTSETNYDAEGAARTLKQADISLPEVVFLPDDLQKKRSKGSSDIRHKVLYGAIHKLLESMNCNARQGFHISFSEPWIYNPTMTSYSRNTPPEKDMSGAKPGAPFFLCSVFGVQERHLRSCARHYAIRQGHV